MSDHLPFYPQPGGCVKLVASGTSSNVALLVDSTNTDFSERRVRIGSSLSGADCWIRFGKDNTVVAQVDIDLYFPAGRIEILTVPATLKYMAVITSGSAQTVWAMRSYDY